MSYYVKTKEAKTLLCTRVTCFTFAIPAASSGGALAAKLRIDVVHDEVQAKLLNLVNEAKDKAFDMPDEKPKHIIAFPKGI